MNSLINQSRPPMFCPGCSHDRSVRALDRALGNLQVGPADVAIVSDIGCSGLFDVFFSTHAFHGLHGRALTYAAGIKLAQPGLKVVVTMGDGGLGIGGAHLLAACRRNLDLTLLVLNNFNFGMTGGQFSCTTPPEAGVGPGFLNCVERPMDVGSVAVAAGAPYVTRCSVHEKDLAAKIQAAIEFEGFSLVDIWGGCPGRYMKRNPASPEHLEARLKELPPLDGPVSKNSRQEYGRRYREYCGSAEFTLDTRGIEPRAVRPFSGRREFVFLGAAGDRIQSAGSLLASAAMHAGLHAAQKNEYNITVLRGPSVSEVILSTEAIDYTGIECPDVVVVLAEEGLGRRKDVIEKISPPCRVIRDSSVEMNLPGEQAHVLDVNFKAYGIKKEEKALSALFLMARLGDMVTNEMLDMALSEEYSGARLESAKDLRNRTSDIPLQLS
ncbi:MAG: 2-oxoacid:acceptor oxidoreductase family protein [Deltaproteobacteria bacterium]|nr:2-oxoacid:acceptor oxidoreductase family protein [Deltaproteobacteria bacterium]